MRTWLRGEFVRVGGTGGWSRRVGLCMLELVLGLGLLVGLGGWGTN